jgi:SAM-dependent methyltransferase
MPACPVCDSPLADKPDIVGSDRQHGVAGVHTVFSCTQCGLGVTLPLASEEQLGAFYPHTYVPHKRTGSLILKIAMLPFMWQRHRALPWNRLRSVTPGNLLDVGCGRGDLASHFVRHGWRVTGTDISPEACAEASARGVETHVGTLSTVTLPEKSFDAVTFRHVLEHVVDPVSDLRRAHAALRSGGQVLITLPNYASAQRRLFRSFWFPLELPRHRHHFSPRSLAAALSQAGFAQVGTLSNTSALGLPASIQYRLFGRCVCESGWKLLAGYIASVAMYPASWLFDRVTGAGDFLHAWAVKP